MSGEQSPCAEGSSNEPNENDDAVIGRAFRQSAALLVLLLALAGGVAWWLRPEAVSSVGPATPLSLPAVRSVVARARPHVRLADVTAEAGLHFVHDNGAYGAKLLPETMGSGCAFFDYDNDGDQDLLLVNSCAWPWKRAADVPLSTSALYQNDGLGHFTDVTSGSGLDVPLYGMGVACGDFDNDGWTDVFISTVGGNHLYRNASGRFVDVTDAAGVGGDDAEWSTSCGWFDYNRDGRLDLFVCNYVRWSPEIDAAQDFRLVGVGRAYGPPTSFEGTFPSLFRNEGSGRFTDVSAAAGLQIRNPATGVPIAKSLGVAPVDLDNDGWLDLVVANDTVQNFVFHNQRDGTFSEIGAASGVAFDSSGNARGAMGIDAAHFRNDEALGLAIGNFANEMTALYVSQGHALQFTDEAIATGLGPPTRLELKFGVFFFDFDLDGRLDLLAANGHLEDEIHKVQASQRHAQPPHLFWNCGTEQSIEFVPLGAEEIGPEFFVPLVGRAAAYADIDNDGDLDVLITANRGAPRLLRNENKLGHHWLRLKLVGTRCPREAIGATIELRLGDERLQRQVMPTRGYLSQSELPVTFGLGAYAGPAAVKIRWPDGSEESVEGLSVDRPHEIRQAQ